MKILFVASECVPFAKAGGLGDVVGALPKVLARRGHDVRVVLPRYGFLDTGHLERHSAPLGVPLGTGEAWCAVLESTLPGSDVPIYFLEHDALFGGKNLYEDAPGLRELARFALLSRGGLQLCRYLDFVPDVVHVHDWPSSWLPVLLDGPERKPPFSETATLLTLHNVAHQPRFPAGGRSLMHLDDTVLTPAGLEDHGWLNALKGGVMYSTMLVAVSPSYAKEIRTVEGGAGLHMLFDYRGADLVGIVNGIDEEVWDPQRDPYVPFHFGIDDLEGKARCKQDLQRELGLQVDPEAPLFGFVARMSYQKGVDLIVGALPQILADGAQVVVLGSGDRALELSLGYAAREHSGRLAVRLGYSESLAHRIEAGADFFLMPSRFEPCGLNQMYSQRYGTIPVVRAVGGLNDTVNGLEGGPDLATGFRFIDPSADALAETVARAKATYRQTPEIIAQMRRNGMRRRFGWEGPAVAYEDTYRWATDKLRRWRQPLTAMVV